MSKAPATPTLEDFKDEEVFDKSRFADKVVEAAPVDKVEKMATAISRVWDDKPSIHQQLSKAPETVRLGATITSALDLSNPDDLEKLNALQAQADDWQGPFIAISELTKQFHAGAWFALIRYAKIFYQKL